MSKTYAKNNLSALGRTGPKRTALFFVLLVLASLSVAGHAPAAQQVPAAQPSKPNIIFILADDMRADDFEHMPQTRRLLAEKGLTFSNAFVSNSVCCPSRASILRGQYAHNHGVLHSESPNGGFKEFHKSGDEKSTVATWLESGGYRTVLLGKYFNGYGKDGSETYVPPGWDKWYAKLDTGYYDYLLNENGTVVPYGDEERDYYTDVLADKARKYVRGAANDSKPFFMYLAPATPHGPLTPAPRHEGAYSNVEAPRPPSFDEGSVDEKEINETYRKRLQMLLSLDEMVAGLIEELRGTGELDNTYVFFTSDNGFHLGEHGLSLTKKTPYEEAIRVPLVVRGPGVPAGGSVEQITLNSDFAPTIAEFAGVPAPEFVDGRSLTPLWDGTLPAAWRSAFLLEMWGRSKQIYLGVRTGTHKYVKDRTGHTVKKELYDLSSDPYELKSRYEIANPARVESLKSRLEALKGCAGESCRAAEDGP